jgi:hypothetical protein
MSELEKRIETLETKLKQAKALKQKQDAQLRAKLSKEQRAKDTRRKILVGAAILAKVERGEWPKDKLLAMMEATLSRNDDRALFDLDATTPAPFVQDK